MAVLHRAGHLPEDVPRPQLRQRSLLAHKAVQIAARCKLLDEMNLLVDAWPSLEDDVQKRDDVRMVETERDVNLSLELFHQPAVGEDHVACGRA